MLRQGTEIYRVAGDEAAVLALRHRGIGGDGVCIAPAFPAALGMVFMINTCTEQGERAGFEQLMGKS